jgi:hypothetical protein
MFGIQNMNQHGDEQTPERWKTADCSNTAHVKNKGGELSTGFMKAMCDEVTQNGIEGLWINGD